MTAASVLSTVEHDLRDLETRLLSVIRSDVGSVTDICVHLAQAGGKRLRPALCFLGAYGSGSKDMVMNVAVALELIHMATLVHDDVIDQAATRRGVATVNTLWGSHHAILSGDFLFARAFSLVASAGMTQVIQILSDVLCAVCEGELQQEHDLFNTKQTEADYLNRVGKKTAVFIASSCQLGATTAGFSAQRADSLRRYAYALGMAFQITDDILDITATAEQVGKPTGNDLRQGNLTMPVIHAMQNATKGNELRELIESRDMSPERLQRCLTIVRAGDSVEYAYAQVNHFLSEAHTTLQHGDLEPEVSAALATVANSVGLRKF